MKFKIAILSFVLMMGLAPLNFASAAIVNCGVNADRPQPPPPSATQQQLDEYQERLKDWECGLGDLIFTIKLIINTLLSWASLVCILLIVVSGFRMILARGNEEAVTIAKTSLSYAIGGFIVTLLSFVILNLVVGFVSGGELNPGALDDAFGLFP